ncbi:sugar phosphate isomerase/epimerase family protein [Blastopirellula marina]|uniref:Probable D-tagatose 3-epimerase n=1 Tax=Blastopirellula marina DSM 3645 TaxID=314230 RepID=A3ZS35_9BACT|nr:sugar phosphate isomerase/epimerase family protein [Blastopirellula marina]EAQ80488.1 probable D-tagatose 3-epimerase [Blastopirellula marina DSM 3645]
MKFGICNETFQDWPLARGFEYAKNAGYAGVEIAPFTMANSAYDITPQQREETRRAAEDAGVTVIGLHWLLAKTEGFYLTTPDDEVRNRTSDYFAELARLCRDLGGTIMVLGSPQQRNLLPGVTEAEAMKYAANCLRRAMPTLEECGITLALEPLGPAEGDFLLTAEKGLELREMIDSPNCQLHLDVKAMSSESKPIPQIIRDSVPHIAHFHANDANKLGPGMGDIDFHPIFAALKEVNYDGWVSVEVFNYEPGLEALVDGSLKYMKSCLGQ